MCESSIAARTTVPTVDLTRKMKKMLMAEMTMDTASVRERPIHSTL